MSISKIIMTHQNSTPKDLLFFILTIFLNHLQFFDPMAKIKPGEAPNFRFIFWCRDPYNAKEQSMSFGFRNYDVLIQKLLSQAVQISIHSSPVYSFLSRQCFLGFSLVQASFAYGMLDLLLVLSEHLLKVSSWRHQWSRVVDPTPLGSITLMTSKGNSLVI